MSEVKWIKITTNIFDDEKIQLIESMPDSDTIIVIWFKLLALAGKSNNGGLVVFNDNIPYTTDMLVTLFRRKESVITLALKTFETFNMIEILDNQMILISNWEKHQNIDKLEQIKDKNRKRVAEYRNRQKAVCDDVTLQLHYSNSDVTLQNKNIDIDKELEKDNKDICDLKSPTPIIKQASKVFKKPTLEEVKAYCIERKNNVNPERWFDFYSSKDWMIGKNKMKDWKAAVRTWEQESSNRSKPSKPDVHVDWMKDYLEQIG